MTIISNNAASVSTITASSIDWSEFVIEELKDGQHSTKELAAKINEVIGTHNALLERIESLGEAVSKVKTRDRGPKSERSMTNEDAWRVMYGDLRGKSHKAAAAELGLSYGQVYSARGGYTFTAVKPDDFKVEEPTKEAKAVVEELAEDVTEEELESLLDDGNDEN